MKAVVKGFCDPQFEPVKAAFENNFNELDDLGACVAITRDGEFVVDLWGGHVDADRTAPWEENTIANVWSSTKTMTAMSLLMLVDRGEVDLGAPVAKYWPEFSQNGKADIKVCHFMNHSAGLSGMDEAVEDDALYDWDWMTSALARQAPWWEPGTEKGYHALTQGFLIGEVVRRVTGQSLGSFFRSEIAEPVEADFHIGTEEELDKRIANLIPPPEAFTPEDPDSVAGRTFANPAVDATAPQHRSWRAAEIPAGNGHGNARSIVRAQTAMANGGTAFGKTLMSEAGTKRVFDHQISGTDLVLGLPLIHGAGYGLNSEFTPISPNPNSFFWGGYGGSSVIVDQDARLCFSYVMNKMESGLLGDPRGAGLAMAMYASIAG